MRVGQRQTRDRGERVRGRIIWCGPETQTVVKCEERRAGELGARARPPQDLERLDGLDLCGWLGNPSWALAPHGM